MATHATREDVYRQGVPRGSFSVDARAVARVDTATSELELDAHGLALDTGVRFRADEGSDLPAPLVEGTTYYAIPIGDHAFAVSATAGGIAIDLTAEGGSFSAIVVDEVGAIIDAAIVSASAVLERNLIAHGKPLDAPIPAEVRKLVAVIAAHEAMGALGRSMPTLTSRMIAAREDLKVFAMGVAVSGAASTGNLATGASPDDTNGRWPAGDLIP